MPFRVRACSFFKMLGLIVLGYFLTGYLFAVFSGLIGESALPEHLRSANHPDYVISVLRGIPRKVTSCHFVEPPIKILGNASVKPISKPGSWQLSAVQVKKDWPFFFPYFAFTFNGVHFRVGCRWDNVDHYYTMPSIALKKF